MDRPLSDTQEQQARQLATALAAGAEEDLLRLARALVAAEDATLFGATEFQVRDAVLRIAARAYEQHLASKQTRAAKLTGSVFPPDLGGKPGDRGGTDGV